jgi:hypothetical protein
MSRNLVSPLVLGACRWCRGEISATRRDALYCSKSCRQAAHRASVRRADVAADGSPARIAYADPPYPGNAGLYRDHPDYAGEVDHRALVSQLAGYDGWALSTSARALPAVLALVVDVVDPSRVDRVRVGAWVRGHAPHPTTRVVNAWEPVVYLPARRVRSRVAGARLIADVHNGTPSRRSTLPTDVVGAKPPAFAAWLFDLVDARPGDTFDDLYPGSGLVGRTWRVWCGLDPLGEDLRDVSRGSTRVAS